MAQRYPRLDTIMRVEQFIIQNSGKWGRKKLWENLPKKMMYQTYKVLMDYLEYSGKITTKKGKVVWKYFPKHL